MVVDNYPASIEVRSIKRISQDKTEKQPDGGSHPSCLGVTCDAMNRRLTLIGPSGSIKPVRAST